MNCRPGDLAVIVNALPAGRFLIGRMVEVLARAEDRTEGPAWIVRLQRPITNPLNGETGADGVAVDAFLRPIRPGDISDEEVCDLYLPKVPERAATRKPVHGGYPEHA